MSTTSPASSTASPQAAHNDLTAGGICEQAVVKAMVFFTDPCSYSPSRSECWRTSLGIPGSCRLSNADQERCHCALRHTARGARVVYSFAVTGRWQQDRNNRGRWHPMAPSSPHRATDRGFERSVPNGQPPPLTTDSPERQSVARLVPRPRTRCRDCLAWERIGVWMRIEERRSGELAAISGNLRVSQASRTPGRFGHGLIGHRNRR
jgi:hypothetical protein